ncbi:hypothetical protein CXB51_026057 [Gossypium anomalum]|uniref:Exostosin GT47 domain-containing protein n=1 Tax=Gossypium anomalum TaxID=47600 RepID=A0A8J5YAY3_9ROSI|nr:hypothetical protein CXB51_026057 [Gossypium anomalum]
MKQYKCLTNNSSMASAVFVPFYAGLDVGRYLWDYNTSVRDSLPYDIVDWLRNRAEWKRLWGRDHFFVAGRIAWYFRRPTGNQPDWGNKLMPSTYIDVIHWQKQVRSRKRQYLFSFASAPHPTMNDSIRVQIINQCLTSKNICKFLDCNSGANKCGTPVQVIEVFRNSVFCLQPPGDSYTRCLMFDSILAGCIPVFFHPYSAYAQYIWYFPKNYTSYSVYIPANDIKHGSVSINESLSRFSEDRVVAMRKEVVKLIPKVIWRPQV